MTTLPTKENFSGQMPAVCRNNLARPTETLIEMVVEQTTDQLDRDYLEGRLSEEGYNEQMSHLGIWADAQYANLC